MADNKDPNSFDKEIADAQDANQQGTSTEGTEQKETDKTEQETVDYREKFVNSSKEAQRLLKENKEKDEIIARLTKTDTQERPDATVEAFPGFENLDPEAQQNLSAYTDFVEKRAIGKIYQDPAIAFAQKQYAETKFSSALDVIVAEFPELANAKTEFKTKYFNPNNVPDNIQDILRDLAKVYLFDKAKDIGAKEAEEQAKDRVQLEDTTGGERGPSVRRSLADWQRMATQNPAKFAALKKEYEADLASGLLKE